MPPDGRPGVVGAGQAWRDRVEQDDDVAPVFYQALRFLQRDVADVDVLAGRLVERAGHHLGVLAGDGPDHVGHFLGPLVDEQDDQVRFGMVLLERERDLLEQHRLAGARRRHDQAALPLADRRDEIDDARRQLLGSGFEDETRVGMQRRQVFEDSRGRPALLLGGVAVDRFDLH